MITISNLVSDDGTPVGELPMDSGLYENCDAGVMTTSNTSTLMEGFSSAPQPSQRTKDTLRNISSDWLKGKVDDSVSNFYENCDSV